MLLKWVNYSGLGVGWCLLCDRPILSEEDFIPKTNTHNYARGASFTVGSASHNERRVFELTSSLLASLDDLVRNPTDRVRGG